MGTGVTPWPVSASIDWLLNSDDCVTYNQLICGECKEMGLVFKRASIICPPML